MCAGGPAVDRGLNPLDGFHVALEPCLDAAVRQIPHPAVKAFRRGTSLDEEPESHTLHPAADQQAPRYEHEQDIISRLDRADRIAGAC